MKIAQSVDSGSKGCGFEYRPGQKDSCRAGGTDEIMWGREGAAGLSGTTGISTSRILVDLQPFMQKYED